MQVIRSNIELKNKIKSLKEKGLRIGFAPTMGALHNGHMSLFDIARKNSDKVVASIFVNPAQFAPNEDFDSYPRREEEDLAKLEKQGVDIAWLPKKEDMYPSGFDVKISMGDIGKELEGVTRPHFFDGVALVVTKLFMLVQPDIAVFGEKDFQQLYIIRKLVDALNIPVEIIGAPVIREASGLAMSSRNLYLSEDELKIASHLFSEMNNIKNAVKNGADTQTVISIAADNLLKHGFTKVDYLELRDSETLHKPESHTKNLRLLAAIYLGKVRLIDNIGW